MTNAILCSPHHEDGKAVYGQRILIEMAITDTDGQVEDLSGEFDLCEVHAKRQLGDIVDRLRALKAPQVIPGQVLSIGPAAPAEPKVIAPTPPESAPPTPEPPTQKPGIFRCLEEGCGEEFQYRSRGGHSNRTHGKKVWKVSWQPLFDVSDWPACTCGYVNKSPSGLTQHIQAAATATEKHFPSEEPYQWDASDLETTMGAALARSIGK